MTILSCWVVGCCENCALINHSNSLSELPGSIWWEIIIHERNRTTDLPSNSGYDIKLKQQAPQSFSFQVSLSYLLIVVALKIHGLLVDHHMQHANGIITERMDHNRFSPSAMLYDVTSALLLTGKLATISFFIYLFISRRIQHQNGCTCTHGDPDIIFELDDHRNHEIVPADESTMQTCAKFQQSVC